MQTKKEKPHKLAVLCATLYSKSYRNHLRNRGLKADKLGFWAIQSEYNKAVCRSLLNRVNKAPEVPKQDFVTAKIGLTKPRTL